MKNIALIGVLLVFAGCAASPPVVNFLWQGKPGEAVRHFGSAEAAQLALDKDVDACSFEIRQTAAGEIDAETGLSKACMAEKGWMPER